jgi:hypothetical protein
MGKNDSFNLTFSPDLFWRWDMENATSEVVQNAIDQHRRTSDPYFIEHDGVETLRVANQFARLYKDALIAGWSTKRNDPYSIGKFGVGLPAALSTFARLRMTCEIYTQDQIWRPSLINDPAFNNAEVTRINVRQRRSTRAVEFDGVEVFISPITPAEWEKCLTRFLFLYHHNRIETSYGAILTDPNQAGKIYTKGIYVTTLDDQNYSYGFDLQNVEIDMERRITDSWQMESEIGKVLREAFTEKPELVSDTLWGKLLIDSREIYRFIPYSSDPSYARIQNSLYERFVKEHGEAIPVESIAQAKELEFYGKLGVIIPRALREILVEKTGSYESIKKNNKLNWSRIYQLSELNSCEQENLLTALDLLTGVVGKLEEEVLVADLPDGTNGICKPGTIALSRNILNELTDTDTQSGVLSTLIHEYAHRYGEDGARTHEREQRKIWGKIAKNLLRK